MRKILVMSLLLLGVVFIYNPYSNSGFVYYDNAPFNTMIIVDQAHNVLVYQKGVSFFQESLNLGFDNWLRNKVQTGVPFTSVIVPNRQQNQQQQQTPRLP